MTDPERPEPILLNIRQAVDVLNLGGDKIQELVARDELPHPWLRPRTFRFPRHLLLAWSEQRRTREVA